MTGKAVLQKSTANETEMDLPVNLRNGLYIVKVSNGKQFQLKKIIVDNN